MLSAKATGLATILVVAYAKAYGARGGSAESADPLVPTLEAAFAGGMNLVIVPGRRVEKCASRWRNCGPTGRHAADVKVGQCAGSATASPRS
jgi:hypothetical protein